LEINAWTYATSRPSLQHSYETVAIPIKHLKHLKCVLTTCIISWCGILHRLHRDAAAVARKRGQKVSALGPGASPCAGSGYQRRRMGWVEQEQRDERRSSCRCKEWEQQQRSRSRSRRGGRQEQQKGCGVRSRAGWARVRRRHTGEGHGERALRWRLPWWSQACATMEELAVGACMRQSGKDHMRAAMEKGNVADLFPFWETMLKVEWSRPIGPDRCIGLETGRPDGCARPDVLTRALSLGQSQNKL
jgi:hypothetical protein